MFEASKACYLGMEYGTSTSTRLTDPCSEIWPVSSDRTSLPSLLAALELGQRKNLSQKTQKNIQGIGEISRSEKPQVAPRKQHLGVYIALVDHGHALYTQ